MKLSEKNSYLLAVIIVISGTLLIAAGFTFGLLSLTEPERSIIADDGSSAEIMESVLSGDIISGDYIISDDEIGARSGVDFDEYLISSGDISIDAGTREVLTSADHSVRKGEWIFIDKGNFTLTLYDKDSVLRKWNIAVGIVPGDKQRKGDNRTPNGVFRINQIQDASKWRHDFGDGNGLIAGAYGPWFIRLYTPPWTGIGIHGTHDADSINSRASEGCIRMSNENVSELKNLVKIGMPVVIVE